MHLYTFIQDLYNLTKSKDRHIRGHSLALYKRLKALDEQEHATDVVHIEN